MKLQTAFLESKYTNILIDGDKYEYGFCLNDIFDSSNKPSELLGIYISEQRDELFFLLDGSSKEINNLCDSWDEKIRVFTIACGKSAEVYRIKYNIVLLVICSENTLDKSSESNLMITRKIILKGDLSNKDQIDIDDRDAIDLPFYTISSDSYEPDKELKAKLDDLSPKDKKLFDLMKKERKLTNRKSGSSTQVKNYSEDEFISIKEWLEK